MRAGRVRVVFSLAVLVLLSCARGAPGRSIAGGFAGREGAWCIMPILGLAGWCGFSLPALVLLWLAEKCSGRGVRRGGAQDASKTAAGAWGNGVPLAALSV